MKPARIALLVQTYLPDHVGGTETYVHHLAEGLTNRGHKVAVIFHGAPKKIMEGQAYQVTALPPIASNKRVHGYRRARGTPPPGFQEFLNDWKPDLAHFHSFAIDSGPDHARVLRDARIPYFFTYHMPAMACARGTLLRWGKDVCNGRIDPKICGACSLEERYFPYRVARAIAEVSVPWWSMPEGPWLTRFAMPSLINELGKSWREFGEGAKHLVACSNWGRDLLITNDVPLEKITVVSQALPGKTRTVVLRLPCPSGRPLRLGYFGRVASEKGVDLLLEAVTLLRARQVPVACEIVGPFATATLESLVRRMAQENSSWFIYGGIKRDETLRSWIESIDLMVFPSRCLETGPLTVLETWEQGTPAIGSNLGGIREFFSQNGLDSLLFELENPASITDAVQRVVGWKGPPPSVNVLGLEDLLNRMEFIYG